MLSMIQLMHIQRKKQMEETISNPETNSNTNPETTTISPPTTTPTNSHDQARDQI